jgi:signal peptidase I
MDETYPSAGPSAPAVVCVAPRPARRVLWRDWLETVLTTIAVFLLVECFVVQGYKVYGSCMEPNLVTGERLLANKIAYRLSGIGRGDIVVFRPPHHPETPFIKRVIGLPGDVLEIRDNRVYINGRQLREPYLHRTWHDDRAPARVRLGMVFVMGDNRDNSSDSRMWGELPIDNIQAKAWLRYWPPERVSLLR